MGEKDIKLILEEVNSKYTDEKMKNRFINEISLTCNNEIELLCKLWQYNGTEFNKSLNYCKLRLLSYMEFSEKPIQTYRGMHFDKNKYNDPHEVFNDILPFKNMIVASSENISVALNFSKYYSGDTSIISTLSIMESNCYLNINKYTKEGPSEIILYRPVIIVNTIL